MQIKMNLRRSKWRLARMVGESILNYKNRGIINLIDVGALGWIPAPWSRFRNAAKIHHLLRFEPQEQASKNPNVTTVGVALWEENGLRNFYTFADQAGSASLFQQNYDYVRENYATLRLRGSAHKAETWFERSALKNITQIECRTLDDVLADLKQPFDYHFIKVDAQGAEYQILKGAEHFLRTSCLGLQLELFEFPIMKGITLLPDVVAYLEEFGFELREQTPTESTFAAAYDCLFLNKNQDNGIAKMIKDIYSIGD
jgi:FkbM family methyltransferase